MSEQKEQKEVKPHLMNAFELITLSQGLNLSTFFEKRQVSAPARSKSHCTALRGWPCRAQDRPPPILCNGPALGTD